VKIAQIDAYRLFPRFIKETWGSDEVRPVWPRSPINVLVRITAEDGTYGIGEIATQERYLGETAEQVLSCVRIYAEGLRGHDIENLAGAHSKMEAAYSSGMPGGRSTRSGIDMALYDLVGKAHDLPVYALLGGEYRTSFELLTNLFFKTPESMAEACQSYVNKGYKGLKVKVGDVLLAEGWSRQALIREMAILESALAVVPRDVYIDADANQGWHSPKWTLASIARFARFDNLSIEQPLHYADLNGAAFVRSNSTLPIILDESVWSPQAMMDIVRLQACDRIVLKLSRVGGFLPGKQIIDICEAAAIGISVDTTPFTMIGDTANCHIAATIRDPYPVDCGGHVYYLSLEPEGILTGGLVLSDGEAHLPDGPGLGVDVDWDVLKRHQALNGESEGVTRQIK